MKVIVALIFLIPLSIKAQTVSRDSIEYVYQSMVIDTTLSEYSFRTRISVSEVIQSEKIKKEWVYSKKIDLDSLKKLIQVELNRFGITDDLTLIKVEDISSYRWIQRNAPLKGQYEIYISSRHDVREIYSNLESNLPKTTFSGFHAEPFVSKKEIKAIKESLYNEFKSISDIKGKELALEKGMLFDRIQIVSNANHFAGNDYGYQYYSIERPNKKMYVELDIPKLNLSYSYMIVLKKK